MNLMVENSEDADEGQKESGWVGGCRYYVLIMVCGNDENRQGQIGPDKQTDRWAEKREGGRGGKKVVEWESTLFVAFFWLS